MVRESTAYRNALHKAQELVRMGNWVTLDTETTGLRSCDEIISWAICAPDGSLLGQGLVKPTVPISPGAFAIHGISDEQLHDALTFDHVWPLIWQLIEGKTVVVYHARFDEAHLRSSAAPYFCLLPWSSPWVCAMELFAVIYGEYSRYCHRYRWQTLEIACRYFALPHEQTHDAASDAKATADLIQALALLAKQELPTGYHPPCYWPCAGGCGEETGPFYYDEDKVWYCNECSLKAGFSHLCARCEAEGKRTIVTDFDSRVGHARHLEPISPDQLCYSCEYHVNLASGAWHTCEVCTCLVKAPKHEPCPSCRLREEQRKRKGREYQREYRARKKAERNTM